MTQLTTLDLTLPMQGGNPNERDGGNFALQLPENAYASEETLHSSLAFLQRTLADLGLLEPGTTFLSSEPASLVASCNAMYALLLQHQRDNQAKEALKTEMQRVRVELSAVDKDRARMEARLGAKEREIGILANKAHAGGEARREEVTRVRREADDLHKRVSGAERRVVQMQHEMKRKDREYERLKERLANYLTDKRKNETAAVDMAGRLAHECAQLNPTGSSSRTAVRSEEGLKAVVAAYETRQAELKRENADLRTALTSLQSEYKEAMNATIARHDTGECVAPAIDEAFFREVSRMGAEELLAELAARLKLLQRRMINVSSQPPVPDRELGVFEQRLVDDLSIVRSVVRDQEALILGVFGALRESQAAAQAAAQEDLKAAGMQYQAQLAAADDSLSRAKREILALTQAQAEYEDRISQLEGVSDQALTRASEAETALMEAESRVERRVQVAVAEVRAELENEMARMAEQSTELQLSLKREQAALRAETGALRERLKAASEQSLSERDAQIEAACQKVLADATAAWKEKLALAKAEARATEERLFRALSKAEQDYPAQLDAAKADKHAALAAAEAKFHAERQAAEEELSRVIQAAALEKTALESKLASVQRAADRARSSVEAEAAATLTATAEEREALRVELASARQHLEAACEAAKEETVQEYVSTQRKLESEVASLRKQLTEAHAGLEAAQSAAKQREMDLLTSLQSDRQMEVSNLKNQIQMERAVLLTKAEAGFEEERSSLQEQIKRLEAAIETQSAQCAVASESARQYDHMKANYRDLMKKWAPGLGAGFFLEQSVGRQAVQAADGTNARVSATAVKGMSKRT